MVVFISNKSLYEVLPRKSSFLKTGVHGLSENLAGGSLGLLRLKTPDLTYPIKIK